MRSILQDDLKQNLFRDITIACNALEYLLFYSPQTIHWKCTIQVTVDNTECWDEFSEKLLF